MVVFSLGFLIKGKIQKRRVRLDGLLFLGLYAMLCIDLLWY